MTSDSRVLGRITPLARTWTSLPSGSTPQTKALCHSSQDKLQPCQTIWVVSDSTLPPNLLRSAYEELMAKPELRGVHNKDFQLTEKRLKCNPKTYYFLAKCTLVPIPNSFYLPSFLPNVELIRQLSLIWELFNVTFAVYTMLYLSLISQCCAPKELRVAKWSLTTTTKQAVLVTLNPNPKWEALFPGRRGWGGLSLIPGPQPYSRVLTTYHCFPHVQVQLYLLPHGS